MEKKVKKLKELLEESLSMDSENIQREIEKLLKELNSMGWYLYNTQDNKLELRSKCEVIPLGIQL